MIIYLEIQLKNELINDMTILNRIPHTRESTENPGTNALARRTKSPFMTRVKSPRVKIFNGRVKNNKIGLRIMLNKPNITLTVTATQKSLTCTPFNI